MVDRQHLLTSKQVAKCPRWISRFDALVPDELNQAAMRELDGGLKVRQLAHHWPSSALAPAIGQIIRIRRSGHHRQPGWARATVRSPRDPYAPGQQTQSQHLHADQ
jgi:hypothetical protein